MLYLVGAWIALLVVSVPTGAAILRWTGATGVFDRRGDRLVLSVWLGVLVLANVLLAASFGFALSARFGAVVGLGMAAAALSWRAVREEINTLRADISPRLIVAFLALVAGVAIFTAQPVVYIDTGFYHAGAIRWLSEYGAVEGIALIRDQFGFASSWFALAAPFNPGRVRDNTLAVMGGFVLLLLALHALIAVSRALRRDARPSDWLVIAGSPLLIVLTNRQALASPSPDIPVSVLVLVVGWAILTVAAAPRVELSAPHRLSPGPAAVPLLLALGAMTIKPQAGPLVAVAALYYVFTGNVRLRRALWTGVLGIVILTPWLAYEFVTTGCPAYPLPVCADVAWSVGAEAAGETSGNVQGRAFTSGSAAGSVWTRLTEDVTPGLGVLAICSLIALGGGLLAGSRTRLTAALRRTATWVALASALGLLLFFLNTGEILIVALAVLSLIPLSTRQPGTGWLLALGLAGIGLTLYAASLQLRFALGYVAVLFARLAVFQLPAIWMRVRPNPAFPRPLPQVFPRPLPKVGLATLLLAAAVAAALGAFARPTVGSGTPLDRLGWLIPPKRPFVVRVDESNGIPYRVPRGPASGPNLAPRSEVSGLCWAADLPCTGHSLNPDVVLRDVVLRDADQGIGGGFARSAPGS